MKKNMKKKYYTFFYTIFTFFELCERRKMNQPFIIILCIIYYEPTMNNHFYNIYYFRCSLMLIYKNIKVYLKINIKLD